MGIAAVTAYVLLHAARVPIVAKQKERQENDLLRVRLRCLELSEEYSMLRRRAKQGPRRLRQQRETLTDALAQAPGHR